MKISSSSYSTKNGKAVPKEAKPEHTGPKSVISLVQDPSEEEVLMEHASQFTLRSVPANADSPTYKVVGRILQGTESIRALVNWRIQVRKILHGLNITTFGNAEPVVEALLSGTPLTLFQGGVLIAKDENVERRAEADPDNAAAIRNAGPEDAANIEFRLINDGIQKMLTNMMPRRVLARVKRFMRRECRKPVSMKVRTYLQHLLRLNLEVLPSLPPFGANQGLSNDEILDIVLYGTPKSWQKEMERQGFDPMEHNVAEVVDFMERIEGTEDFDAEATKVKAKVAKTNNKKSPSGKKKDEKEPGELKYCSHHGHNPSHTSSECFVLHPELKEAKKSKSKSKSWSRKAADSKAKTKSDLAAFIRKEVSKGVDKAVNSNKRKASGESDDDLNAFDLEEFNFKDMENLKIDSDDDISV